MASSSSIGSLLTRATKFPDRIFPAYLAEDYDGKSQYVLVKLTHGGVSSGYKVRVAAGDHSGHEPMPEGTRVTVTSIHGDVEAMLGQKGWRFGAGFAQLVLASSRNGTPITGPGNYDVVFNGQLSGAQVNTPAIVQDTHGFTGVAGDMQVGSAGITSWSVPDGMGGVYNVGFEEFLPASDTIWWPTLGVNNPQQVPYVSTGASVTCGSDVSGSGAPIRYQVLVNGAPIIDEVAVSGGGFWIPFAVHVPTPFELHDGDLIKMRLVFVSGFGQNYISFSNTIDGSAEFAGQQGLFIMTRTGDLPA